MHEIDDALPLRFVSVRPQAGAAGRDPRIGRRAGHLGENEPHAAQSMRAVMHEMPVGEIALRVGGILRHRRHHHPVRHFHATQAKFGEHWCGAR